MMTQLDIPNKWKTVGALYRGDALSSVAVMSGWSHAGDHNATSDTQDRNADLIV